MFRVAIHQLRIACTLFVCLTLLTGLFYPLALTGLAKLFFPNQATGHLLMQEGQKVGSLFIGQYFTRNDYFWGRPSATTPVPYNGASSSGSNWGPTHSTYLSLVAQRVQFLRQVDPLRLEHIPVELVTASASGLDAEISPLAAFYQVPRIAQERHLSVDQLNALINQQQQNRSLGILGEPRVNVLQLNLALDSLKF